MQKLAGVVVVVLVHLSLVTPATAEVVTRTDPEPKCSQGPALDVKRATFNYADKKFVWRIKMGDLSKKRTRVIGRYTVGSYDDVRYDVMLMTKYDADGNKRVVGQWRDGDDNSGRFTKGLTATWDWSNDLIVFTLTSHLKGKRARAYAYSVAKGAFHGPPCGDFIQSGRMDRG